MISTRYKYLLREETDYPQHGVNSSFDAALNGTAARRIITQIRRRDRTYLQWHAPDESDEMNPKCLHSLTSIGRFVNAPPLPLLKNFAQRLSHRGVVLLAGNLFFGGTIEPDHMITGNIAFLGIKFRKRF